MSEELKPCPFCASNDIQIEESGVWTGKSKTITHCEVIHHCAGHYGVEIHLRERTKAEVIATWNSREAS